jgi:hypothetical protein
MKSKRGEQWPPPVTNKTPWTMPIEKFGRVYYNLGRSASYAAAKRREIPVLQIGGRLMGLPHVAEAELRGHGAVRPRGVNDDRAREAQPAAELRTHP